MTLTSDVTQVSLTGNGSDVTLSITYKFWASSNIRVILRTDSTGAETNWTEGTQYNITGGSGATGTLTVVTSPTDYTPATGETLFAIADEALTNEDPLPLGGSFPSTAVEEQFDQTTRMIQQLESKFSRALLQLETTATGDLSIPFLVADKYLRVNPAGTAFILDDSTGDTGPAGAPGDLTSVAGDTSPELGGALDVVTFSIVSTSARDITLTPDTTGDVVLDGLKYPQADGTANYFMTTNGSAQLAFAQIYGQQTIWLPKGSWVSRTTNGPSAGSVETSVNKIMYPTWDFDDTTEEYVQAQIQMPKSWDEGTVIAQFLWKGAAITNDVIWGIQAVALADDDLADSAFGTGIEVTDTAKGTAQDIAITAETAAITVAGLPAAEELVVFEVYRKAADGSDTFSGDAKLLGVKIHYTTDAAVDD